MPPISAPMPLSDPIATPRRANLKPGTKDENEGLITEEWIPFFTDFGTILQSVTRQAATPVQLTAQSASIGVTPIPTSALAPGLYRASYYTRITRAAGVSSSLVVTFSWTDGGIACALSSGAITGNTTATVGTGTLMIRVDQATPVSFSTTYASVGAPTMQHSLDVILEAINS